MGGSSRTSCGQEREQLELGYDRGQSGGLYQRTSTYKLRFMWGNYSPTETTATITVTATMTDSSTQSATLTFKIPSGPPKEPAQVRPHRPPGRPC
jgi:hypothetical protein